MAGNFVRGLPVALLAVGFVLAAGSGTGIERAEAAPRPGQELPDGVSAEMVEAGQAVYAGDGFCMTCHGAEGEGTPVGPALNDGDWIHIDGSFDSIVEIIDSGVMQPEQHPGAMLPRGGGDISDEDVRAVAAYVWTLSHGG